MATTRLLSAMVATWNNVATTFTGLKLNVTDTASASGSLLMDLQVGGASKASVAKDGAFSAQGTINSAGHLRATGGGSVQINSNTGALSFGSAADLFLARDAANTLALRNGTAAQAFNVYNTYTDASNYERGVFDWTGTANTLRIGTEAAGTGTVRDIQLVAGSNTVTMTPGAGNLLTLNGGLTTGAAITSGGRINVAASSQFTFSGRGRILAPDDGIMQVLDAASVNFTRLILGTNDASGIAIKKNGTAFNFVLGNDTGDAAITSSKVTTSATDFFHNTSAALANGAAAQVATMTNGPTAGNPTKWIAINDNGVTRYIPAW